VLALPDFTQAFMLECDALETGIGAFFMQDHHPIAFERYKLKNYKRHYSVYDKDFFSIIHTLAKFQQYLVGNRFKVKTHHNNLTFIRD